MAAGKAPVLDTVRGDPFVCMVLLCVAIHKYGVTCVAIRCMVLLVFCVAPLYRDLRVVT